MRGFFPSLAALTAALAVAAAAYAGVGSVINSFFISTNWHEEPLGIYRDGSFVYTIVCDLGIWRYQTYTPTGSLVRTGITDFYLADADHSVLGDGYFAACNARESDVRDFVASSGSFVGSWPTPSVPHGYAYIPNTGYKYYADRSYVYRFTTAGSLVNSFSPRVEPGPLAATSFFAGREGEYIILGGGVGATDPHVYTGDGSLIATFKRPGYLNQGCVCGPGYPPENGITYWCNQVSGRYSYTYVFQISLGNGVPVEPTSVGKVKALFR
jgi:hypothetical protein